MRLRCVLLVLSWCCSCAGNPAVPMPGDDGDEGEDTAARRGGMRRGAGGSGGAGGPTPGPGGAGGAGAGGASRDMGGSAGSNAPGADAGSSDGAAAPADAHADLSRPDPASPSLSLFNVVTNAPVRRYNPIEGSLNRVEMPPRFTLVANVPVGTASVAFSVDGKRVRVDDARPFLLTETDGKPARWTPGFGSFSVTIEAYAMTGAQGTMTGKHTQTVTIAATGMDPAFQPLSDSANRSWVSANLDKVLVRKSFKASNGMTLPYRLYTPAQHAPGVKYPLVLYLHHRGVRGTDNARPYDSQLFYSGRSIVSPNMQAELPSFVVVPQCSNQPDSEEWARWTGSLDQRTGSYNMAPEPSRSGAAAMELAAQLVKDLNIDPDRVYIAGESMGGIGVWEFTQRKPDAYAAGIAMAGYSDKTKADRIVHIPFWVFHGASDTSNPVAGSRLMVQRLKDLGAKNVIYTEYAGTAHTAAFNRAWSSEADLLPWLFSWTRQP